MELLNDMALFVEVGKAMSFRRAAETLDMPSSTLSRRISNLEKAIGLRLLHRTTRKVELTEAGQIYFERCKHIVDEARLAHEQLGEMLAQPSGLLRVSLPVDFAIIFLAPLITDFAALYPGISFDFDLTPRRADLVSENVDVAIRMGEPQDSNLIARKLAELRGQLFASPKYLQRHGRPEHPSQLPDHECLCRGTERRRETAILNKGFPNSNRWTLYRVDETVQVNVGGRFMLNNVGMMRRLATLDQGIIFTPPQTIADDLKTGLLVPVLPDWFGEPRPVYALTETRLLPAKTQRFIEFSREHMQQVVSPQATAAAG